jgi:hypothetical protein
VAADSSSNNSYRYALLGIIGLVALVAIFLIFRISGPLSVTLPSETLSGKADSAITQTFTITEGQTKNVTLEGVEYEVTGIAIIPHDESPKDAVIISVNGEYSYKIYEGSTKLLHGIKVRVDGIGEGMATITMFQTTNPVIDPNPNNRFGVFDTLSLSQGKLYTIAGTDYQVTLTAVSSAPGVRTARFSVNGVSTSDAKVGDTVHAAGATITIQDIVRSPTKTFVSYVVGVPPISCGAQDGQNTFCRGTSACCGGSCVALPTCAGKPNGPVFTCGQRAMYCCNQQLTFGTTCGGSQ